MSEALGRYGEEKRKLDVALAELGELAGEIGARSLAHRLTGELRDKLRAEQLHVLFVGEFNHGKSTLVNALLGGPVLPTGVTPTTAVAHRVAYAEAPSARAVYDSGETRTLDFGELSSFSAGAASGKAPRQIDIGYPAEILRSGLVLLDTPGVNDAARALTTQEFIPRADAIVFVLDAGQPVKESERAFIEQKLRDLGARLLFVVAKADLWSEPERAAALRYVHERLAELVPEPRIVAVSAKAALDGREGSGLAELERELGRLLDEDRSKTALESAAREGLTLSALLERGLEARTYAAGLDSEALRRTLEQLKSRAEGASESVEARRRLVREEAESIKAWVRRDLDTFCNDVSTRLPALLEPASANDVRLQLGPFLEHTFGKWAEAEIAEITEALEKLAERAAALVRRDAELVGEGLVGEVGKSLRPQRIEVDTFAADVGIFAVLSLGVGVLFANALVGGLLLASAPALAFYSRERTEQAVKQRAIEIVPVVLRELADKVGPKLEGAVEEFASRLETWLREASEHFHRDLVEILEQSARRRESGSYDAVAESTACAELAASLSRIRGAFAA